MKGHIELCEGTARELLKKLPEVQNEDRNILRQALTHLGQLAKSSAIDKLLQDIASLKTTLELWLQILQLEATRNGSLIENQNHVTIKKCLGGVTQKMKSLEFLLNDRKKGPYNISVLTTANDAVARKGEECLSSARTVRKACTTIYHPIAASEVDQRHSNGYIPQWVVDVERVGGCALPSPPASSAGSGSRVASDLDQEYNTGSIRSTGVSRGSDRFTADVLNNLINASVCNAQRSRRQGKYDEAIVHQKEAIEYCRQRARVHNIKFTDEPTLLATLADWQFEGHLYANAVNTFERLLKKEDKETLQAVGLKHKLAIAYLAQGKYESAARPANEVYDWKQKNLRKGDHAIIETLSLLSTIYDKMGRRDVSREFESKALQHRMLRSRSFDREMENAVKQGVRPQEVQDILEKEDDANRDREILALKAFHLAVALDREELVAYLWGTYAAVSRNIEAPNRIGMPPLISATSWGHDAIVRFLVHRGEANVNAKFYGDSSGDTALLIAADKQFKSIVELLLACGANARVFNNHERNPLHRAMGPPLDEDDTTRREIVLLLLQKDREALLEAQCSAGKRPLHLAAEAGNKPMIRLLLAQGADIEATDRAGRTPLFCAIDSGKATAVEALVDGRANLKATDNYGRTIKKAANRPTGNAHRIQKILKAAKKEQAKSRHKMSTDQSPSGSRSSPPLSQISSESSTISALSPPDRNPSIFGEPSLDEEGPTDALSLKSMGTTASEWARSLQSRF